MLDNTVVRQGWKAAKAIVTDILDKHEAKTITARRWDERKLSYSIKGRTRATYMISYFELAKDGGPGLSRSLELNESVLRYLITRVDMVPANEAELASREESDDFVVPAPPVEEAAVVVAEEVVEDLAEDLGDEEVPEGLSVDGILADDDASEPVAAAVASDAESETEAPKSGEGA